MPYPELFWSWYTCLGSQTQTPKCSKVLISGVSFHVAEPREWCFELFRMQNSQTFPGFCPWTPLGRAYSTTPDSLAAQRFFSLQCLSKNRHSQKIAGYSTDVINITTFFKVTWSSSCLIAYLVFFFSFFFDFSHQFKIMQTKHFYWLAVNISSEANCQILIVFLISLNVFSLYYFLLRLHCQNDSCRLDFWYWFFGYAVLIYSHNLQSFLYKLITPGLLIWIIQQSTSLTVIIAIWVVLRHNIV